MRAALCYFLLWTTYLLQATSEEVEFPQELIDRLSHSEIHSISDLQRLLDIDSVRETMSSRSPSTTSTTTTIRTTPIIMVTTMT